MLSPKKGVVPSRLVSELRSLVGRRILAATRFSWWAPEVAKEECGLASEDVFSLTAGPVSFAFDSGVVLAASSDPRINSVCVWVERDETGRLVWGESLSRDEDLYPISATDPKYASAFWHRMIGATVSSVYVLVRNPLSLRLAELPNEVGLRLLLSSGESVVAAHGLHNDSDDFVTIPDQYIMERLRGDLTELQIGHLPNIGP